MHFRFVSFWFCGSVWSRGELGACWFLCNNGRWELGVCVRIKLLDWKSLVCNRIVSVAEMEWMTIENSRWLREHWWLSSSNEMCEMRSQRFFPSCLQPDGLCSDLDLSIRATVLLYPSSATVCPKLRYKDDYIFLSESDRLDSLILDCRDHLEFDTNLPI